MKKNWPKTVTAPEGGWKERTWYIVSCSFATANPLHNCLLYTGFLDKEGVPGGYSGVMPLNYAASSHTSWNEVREIHFVRELCDSVGDVP